MIPRILTVLLLCLPLLAPPAAAQVHSCLPGVVSTSGGVPGAGGCFDVDVEPIQDGVYDGVYALVSGTLTLYKPYVVMASSTQIPTSAWGEVVHVAIHVNATWEGSCRDAHEDMHLVVDGVADDERSSDPPTSAFCPGAATGPTVGAASALRGAALDLADRSPAIAAALLEAADALAPTVAPVHAPAVPITVARFRTSARKNPTPVSDAVPSTTSRNAASSVTAGFL